MTSMAPRVLIVDDEPANRKLLARIVAGLSFESIEATDGWQALRLLSEGASVDCILLDWMMPGLDGQSFLKKVAPIRVPILVITALSDRHTRHTALRSGAADFITKPIDHVEVAAKLRTTVELGQLRSRELRNVKGQLDASLELLRLRFEQSPFAQLSIDASGTISAWNSAAERLFGWESARAVGESSSQLFALNQPRSMESMLDVVGREGRGKFTIETQAATGSTVTCDWECHALRDKDGQFVGVTVDVVDVSERVELRRALEQSQKMEVFGKLAGGVAHDFNNVLGAIVAFGQLAMDALDAGSREHADVQEVLEAAKRGAELTRQLLSFSRRRSGNPVPMDLNRRLEGLSRLLRRALGSRAELVLVLSPSPLVVEIEPVQFDQVVLNLVVNARDAMPERQGRVRVGLKEARDQSTGKRQAVMEVEDDGSGISAAVLERIFEPFFTTKHAGYGTGLGLSTCASIVNGAGGTIEVRSQAGSGATFTVKFPTSDAVAHAPSLRSQAARRGHGQLILLVEDDDDLRAANARVLRNGGYRVITAGGGDEGRRIVEEQCDRIELVVTDVVMPHGGGIDLAAHVTATCPDIAVLLTTGHVDDIEWSAASAYQILWKPVAPTVLLDTVAEALEGRGARAAHEPARSHDVPTPPATVPLVPSLPRDRGDVAPGSLLVLLVEDDAGLAEATSRCLRAAACEVAVARDVSSGLAWLAAHSPSLVLCDLTLPDGSGADVVRAVRRAGLEQAPAVVVLTGGVVDECIRDYLEQSEVAVLTKPVAPPDLLALVAEVRASTSGGYLLSECSQR